MVNEDTIITFLIGTTPFYLSILFDFADRFEEMSSYQMELSDWENERRNKVFKQPTQLDIDMDSDVSIKSVLSNIKKHASYGAGSSGSNS